MRPTLRATGAAAVAALMLTPSAASAAPRPADTVLRGGTIRTFDAKFSVVRALAVRDGRIVYAGGAAACGGSSGRAREGPEPPRADGDARASATRTSTCSPAASSCVTCNLEYAALTVAAVPGADPEVPRRGRRAGANEFLQVVNWYRQAMVPPARTRRRRRSTRSKTERPIIVSSSDGHTTLVNSKALQVAGITAATPTRRAGASTTTPTASRPGSSRTPPAALAEAKVPAPTAQDTQRRAGGGAEVARRSRRHRRRASDRLARRRSTRTARCAGRASSPCASTPPRTSR